MEHVEDPENHSDVSDENEEATQNQQTSAPNAKKIRSSRACVACRRMKTRCEVDEALGNACKLCIRARRQCIMQAIPRRRKRKTTERVADLERKINTLTALLAANDSSGSGDPSPPSAQTDGSIPGDLAPGPSQTLIEDALNHGLLDWKTACKAFDRYRRKMCQYFPFVVFPPTSDAKTVSEQQPTLFFAIVAAALTSINARMDGGLGDMLTKDLALRIMYRGERSLELVQTLLVHISFYIRAKHMRELNFNQLVHIASTMALDIGLGRRPHKPTSTHRTEPHQLESLAGRRAWLGCYYMATSVSMSLRHPAFLRWSVYVEECLDVLSSEPPALPSDVWLCDLIRIQHIAEDASIVFSMDDPGSIVTLRDVKTQYQIGSFRHRLEHWRRYAKTDLTQPYVRHVEASADLFIHEIALHSEHNIDELRAPIRPVAVKPGGVEVITSSLNDLHFLPARIESLFACLSAIHKVFDAMLSMEFATLCTLPNLFFVRTGYAARALRKLLSICETQTLVKGQIPIDIKDLKFEDYMDSLIALLSKIHEANHSQVARAFGMVLKQIRAQDTDPSTIVCGHPQQNPDVDTRQPESLAAPPLLATGQSHPPPTHGEQIYMPPSDLNSFSIDLTSNASSSRQQQHLDAPLAPNLQSTVPPFLQHDMSDSLMSDIDILQWFEQDFQFDDLEMYQQNDDLGSRTRSAPDVGGWQQK
ncbi:uncharacterized protein Z518_05354 [Rhinocladiella mackenziei CBS 650.93]|uniref:Zn(2)-C6 fungal-type domain-containing protein n=1 Tax=Rhinocladiella mackenziei CBS 650.93 TaxID=1442369 RepID=A0A0D2IF95_9EURO|nr:uncharacterized protein Z518_05354 [Rhinocladiella mackenziei CBS 650.93]KIX04484.1 hypothetical protein Z518_05354 [Rhinocladiella mackenziei CBS 650.93]